jgi:hypothetical protein
MACALGAAAAGAEHAVPKKKCARLGLLRIFPELGHTITDPLSNLPLDLYFVILRRLTYLAYKLNL